MELSGLFCRKSSILNVALVQQAPGERHPRHGAGGVTFDGRKSMADRLERRKRHVQGIGALARSFQSVCGESGLPCLVVCVSWRFATNSSEVLCLTSTNSKRLEPPRFDGGIVRLVLIAIFAMLLLGVGATVFFQVQPEEAGIVLRFGKFNRTTTPGLHLKLPYPIETVQKVPIQRQLKQEFGFQTVRADVRSQYADKLEERLMLTGDLNVASVEWIAQYKVTDPYAYLFKVRNVEDTFRDMNEAVMRQIIGDRSVTEVLTIGRGEIELEAQKALQLLCEEYETGILVDQIVLQNVNPPDAVKASFDEVNRAQQERERLINEAKTEFNKVVPAAKGEAEQMIAQARGYAVERINRAEGEAARFTALREVYERAPEVTRKRIYLETMSKIYPRAKQKIIVSDGATNVLPLLQLQGGK